MFKLTQTPNAFHLEMSATLENIELADGQLTEFITQQNLPVDVFAVRILLRESLLNAVIHGSGKDPDERVIFNAWITDAELTLTIKDFGPGFTRADKSAPLNVLGDGGRGLALMEIYADTMTYNEVGNQLTLKKKFNLSPSTDGGQTPITLMEEAQ